MRRSLATFSGAWVPALVLALVLALSACSSSTMEFQEPDAGPPVVGERPVQARAGAAGSPVGSALEAGRALGVVTSYDAGSGQGYISRTFGGISHLFTQEWVVPGYTPQQGDLVSFVAASSRRARVVATDVRPETPEGAAMGKVRRADNGGSMSKAGGSQGVAVGGPSTGQVGRVSTSRGVAEILLSSGRGVLVDLAQLPAGYTPRTGDSVCLLVAVNGTRLEAFAVEPC